MASKFIPTFLLILLVLFCFLLTREEEETSGCSSVYACVDSHGGGSLNKIGNRKMMSALKDKKSVLKVSTMEGSSSRTKYGDDKLVIGEMRKVPTGPNPVHHHNIGNPIIRP